MEVDEAMCVGWVKIHIEVLEGIPHYQQQLFFGGKTLDNCQQLSCYGIQGGSVLTFKQSVVLSARLCSRSDTFYVVHTYSSDLVGDVKAMIAKQMDVCADQLEVVYNRKPLKDGQKLCDCGIRDLCTVDVFKKVQSKIVIKSLTGRDFSETVEVHPSDTVVDVKRKIQSLVGVSPCELHLINTYNGEVLNDEETLSSCIIWEGSTLQFMRRKPPLLMVKGGLGEVVTLAFSPWVYVWELEADICRKMGISDKIRLFCRRKKAGIFDNLPSHDHAESSVATGSIDAEILSREGFVAEEQQLILNSRELKFNHTLSEYKIQGEDTLYLIHIVKIFVKTCTGEVIPLEFIPGDTIEGVKTKIQKREGFLVDKQQLILSGTQLKDSCTLSDYSIQKGAVLELVLKSGEPGEIEIFVKPKFMVNTVKLKVERNDSIWNVKAKIKEKEGLLVEFQELIFANRYSLRDEYSLSDYGVQAEDIIDLHGGTVFIKGLTGKTIYVTVEDNYTVEAIRTKVCDKEGIPPNLQRLIFSGKQLEDGR